MHTAWVQIVPGGSSDFDGKQEQKDDQCVSVHTLMYKIMCEFIIMVREFVLYLHK